MGCHLWGHTESDTTEATAAAAPVAKLEDDMVGWHPQLNGHKFEQTPGDAEGQGTLPCCSTWGH